MPGEEVDQVLLLKEMPPAPEDWEVGVQDPGQLPALLELLIQVAAEVAEAAVAVPVVRA
jgi:hypothetical protein